MQCEITHKKTSLLMALFFVIVGNRSGSIGDERFHNGNGNVNTNIKNQYQMFIKIQKEFSRFSSAHNLAVYKDERWNLTIPKVMDNMIIGFMKL